MADTLLPPSIRDDRFLILEQVLNRIAELDLSILAVYNIDTVDESALIHLADQFNVLGYRGWLLCETEEQKRSLIKDSLILHKTAGTPFAIRRSLVAVGFADAEITENPPFYPDGTVYPDGTDYPDGILAGGFNVDLNLGQRILTAEQEELVIKLVEEWKNRRSHLLDINLYPPLFPRIYTPPFYPDGTFYPNGYYKPVI